MKKQVWSLRTDMCGLHNLVPIMSVWVTPLFRNSVLNRLGQLEKLDGIIEDSIKNSKLTKNESWSSWYLLVMFSDVLIWKVSIFSDVLIWKVSHYSPSLRTVILCLIMETKVFTLRICSLLHYILINIYSHQCFKTLL